MSKRTKVLYNAECPVCNFEISHYAKYADKNALDIQFDDLNGAARSDWNIDADTAARRLYVEKDGVRYGGIPGFIVLWEEMPRYRWLARLVGLPGVKQIASLTYDYILAPLIYRWHRLRIWNRSRKVNTPSA
ncbi:MAG: DUF393 domain-containing protein [Pseudomonadota bacterium]